MKLSIGTVQFGLDYGISNKNGKTSNSEVKSILTKALDAGIEDLDTAYSYGESESVLGKSGFVDKFKVVTKTRVFTDAKFIDTNNVLRLRESFDESLRKLTIPSVYALMIHQITDLYKQGGDLLIRSLYSLKEEGLVQKIGVSLYSAKDVDFLLENFKFDIVQLPVSIFDQRLIISGSLKKLKDSGIEIHVRSAFLQGLVFMKPGDLISRPRFDGFRTLFQTYYNKLQELNLTPAQVALSFLNNQPEVDKIVCGVNNKMQLSELIASLKDPIDVSWVSTLAVNDEEVVNPLKWLNDKL